MAARHTPTEHGSRGCCKPSPYPARGQVPRENARKHDAVERSVAHGRRTIRSRITFDVIAPTATKESLLKKVSEGYKRNPEKWSKLYHDLFPKLPIKQLNSLRDARYKFFQKHAKRTLQPDVPYQMLVRGSISCHSEYFLPASLRKEYLAFEQKIQSIERKHDKRVKGLDALIDKLTKNKLARYAARRSEADFLSSSPSRNRTPDAASDVSSLAADSPSLTRRTPSSLCSTSTQTDEFSDSSLPEELPESPLPENDFSSQQELREQLRNTEERKTQLVLDLQQAQLELSILQEEKDDLLENQSSALEEMREQLRKAEEDKQQLIQELQQTRFELCVLEEEKEDKLAKKKKGPLSFLRKKN